MEDRKLKEIRKRKWGVRMKHLFMHLLGPIEISIQVVGKESIEAEDIKYIFEKKKDNFK